MHIKTPWIVSKAKKLFLRIVNQWANQVTLLKHIKKAMEQHSNILAYLVFQVKKL